jgi:hypothetical protein
MRNLFSERAAANNASSAAAPYIQVPEFVRHFTQAPFFARIDRREILVAVFDLNCQDDFALPSRLYVQRLIERQNLVIGRAFLSWKHGFRDRP